MILQSLTISASEFETGTGWRLTADGACKADICIPLDERFADSDQVDVEDIAKAMGLPLIQDEEHDLWALGPESIGSRALTSALAPELELPDLSGELFRLSDLRGQRVVVYAWAPY